MITMPLRFLLLSLTILFTTSSAVPLNLRAPANTVVQGILGTDDFWNDYDGGHSEYVLYSGNGSQAAGWPPRESWISFNQMWIINQRIMARSCDILYQVPNTGVEEMQHIYDGIKLVAQETRVDHRFILAAVMQETKGCVRAPTSTSTDGIQNPGLLQDFKGTSTCNNDGKVLTPCPKEQIIGMIREGVAGTDVGHGYAVDINEQQNVSGMEFAEAYYRAARLYNSGAIDPTGDLGRGGATHCYASDIANRLMGWTDSDTKCTLDDAK